MSYLAVVPVLLLLVFVHELGHFITAKLAGVKVLEFGFGYPPRLFGFHWRGTLYSFNLLPLGGFVRLLGEEDPSDPESFARRSPWVRLVVLASGSLMNALLPIVLFTAAFMIPKEVLHGTVVVAEVAPNSPAALAGIQPGEAIVRVADRVITNPLDVRVAIQRNLGKEVPIVLRQGRFSQREVYVTPRWNPPPGEGNVGVRVAFSAAYPVVEALPLWQALPKALTTTVDILVLTRNEIIGWVLRTTTPNVAGPIGIVQATGEVAEMGWPPLLQFTALLSINLAIVNILPLPMLDGGRIAFVLLEIARRGKRISPQRESLVHLVGLAFLLALVVLVSYRDILRILNQESFLP